ncbi:MAG: Wzz/FepE/Etk N-terminal domain-containing protein [bacterium]|nr:Wzz/FepE/Etk N-terminal domain-containing protein [bacterium]
MSYLSIIAKHWLSILFVTLICAGTAVGLSFLPAQYYESEVQVLIVQEQQETTDSYTSQKAAEKLGNTLVNVIYSFDFLDRVIATGYVNEEVFSGSAKDREKLWKDLVKAQVVPESSLIRIFGYGTDPGKAENVALGVSQVLTTSASYYHGSGETVKIKHISGPITSVRPVKPNIPLNGVAAGILGFMLTYGFFVLRNESQQVKVENKGKKQSIPQPAQQIVVEQSEPIQQNLHAEQPRIDHYEVPGTAPEVDPYKAPEYKVLDEYPEELYNYGSTLEDENKSGDDTAVTMPEHFRD